MRKQNRGRAVSIGLVCMALSSCGSPLQDRVHAIHCDYHVNETPTVKRRNFSSLTSSVSAVAVASSFRIARK